MTYDDMGEYRRQVETNYRLGMRGGWTQGAKWTRRILIVLTIGMVLTLASITRFPSLEALISNSYLTPEAVPQGKVWQILTAPLFLVSCWWQGLFHLGYLLTFGPKVEREWGNARFLRFYIIIAIVSTLIAFALLLFTPMRGMPVSTASAPIFAVLVAYAFMWPRDAFFVFGLFPMPIYTIAIFLCASEILFFFLGGGDFAGSAAGIAIAYASFKIPALRSIILGDRRVEKATTKGRVSRQEHGRVPKMDMGISPSTGSTDIEDPNEAGKDKKRSGYLEL